MTTPQQKSPPGQSKSSFNSFITSAPGKAAAQIGILLLSIANGVAVFFSSLLIGSADASGKTISYVWIFGFIWIALFTCVAYFIGARKGWGTGLVIAASALPAAFFVANMVVDVGVVLRAIFKFVSS
jgi:Na+/melibiose symporter-like transporter